MATDRMTRGSVSRKHIVENGHDDGGGVVRRKRAKGIQSQHTVAKDDNSSLNKIGAKDASSDSASLLSALHVKTSTSDHGQPEGATTHEPSQTSSDVLQARKPTFSLLKPHRDSTATHKDFHRPRTQREIPPLSRLEIL